MSRVLRFLGIAGVAGTVWLVIADAAGWIPSGTADPWIPRLLVAAGVLFAGGIALSALSPLGRELSRRRCVRCGTRIEPGQVYCRDHLQATLNEYRDRTRPGLLGRPRG